jgi:hypothetical protein
MQRKNLLGAETCAREMGVVSLDEALDLVCLVAEVAPERLDSRRPDSNWGPLHYE